MLLMSIKIFSYPSIASLSTDKSLIYIQNAKILENSGQPEPALESLNKALEIFKYNKDIDGIVNTKISQSNLLKSLGYYTESCYKATEALDIKFDICSNKNQDEKYILNSISNSKIAKKISAKLLVKCLTQIGDRLRIIDKVQESETVLTYAIKIANNSSIKANFVKLALANTVYDSFLQNKDFYISTVDEFKRKEIITSLVKTLSKAVSNYKSIGDISINSNDNKEIILKSKINLLKLYLEYLEWRNNASSYYDFSNQSDLFNGKELRDLVQTINSLSSNLPINVDLIYARLNFANTLIDLCKIFKSEETFFLNVGFNQIRIAIDEVNNIHNDRAKSYTLYYLAKFYTYTSQTNLALETLEFSKSINSKSSNPELSFQIDAELAQTYSLVNKISESRLAYESAIQTIDIIRHNLDYSNIITRSLSKEFETVYKNYFNFLFNTSLDIKRALDINNKLHVIQIENYLGCNKLDLIPITDPKITTQLPPVIYSFNLGNSIEIVLRESNGRLHHHSADHNSVMNASQNLNIYFQNNNNLVSDESLFSPYIYTLYNEIIKPLEPFLPSNGPLIFSLDASLENIPISMLRNENQYLSEKYYIINSIGSQIKSIKKVLYQDSNILIGGLSQRSPSFNNPSAPPGLSPLPQVTQEVELIKLSSKNTKELINKNFTIENFQSTISHSPINIIHLSTHGQFSSDPSKTLILAWDKVINVRDIDQLLKSTSENFNAIDLLVLSACETAKGDSNSVLGIAGFATQSGAKSVLATLWQADANATVIFMNHFYSALKHNKSKAEAFNKAQSVLRNDPRFNHPYFWAPFILIGDWL